MTFIRGEKVIVNQKNRGQFLVTLMNDLETEANGMIEVEMPDGGRAMLPIKFCKFKPYTGKEE